jgi:hypothetical protein
VPIFDTIKRDYVQITDLVRGNMNKIVKDVVATGFDLGAWQEELLALNPWARGLTIDDENEEFAAARQKATIARYAEGKEVWNAWAKGMLALRAAVEPIGQSAGNDATALWPPLASAVFSDVDLEYRFEESVRFDTFLFPEEVKFKRATFGGDANFQEATFTRAAVFSGEADFSGKAVSFSGDVTFNGAALFEGATFSGEAYFQRATFSGDANFPESRFNRAALFLDATFSDAAWFRGATFSGDANFQRATFSSKDYFPCAFFERATFTADADFERATFSGDVSFQDAAFSRAAAFPEATFSRAALFQHVTVSGDANFQEATFGGDANFQSATFDSKVFFNATFSGVALFPGATFNGDANFSGTFVRAVLFKEATFNSEADFQSAIFGSISSFDDVRLNAEADFKYAKFKEAVTFAGSIFRKSASFDGIDSAAAFSLANATFKQVPGFISASFKGTLRLDNVKTPNYPQLGYTSDKDATARFRELRRQAAEAQDRERELEFFAQELRTGRFHAKGLPSWVPKVWDWRFWFGLGFGGLSDFGRSLWRPLLSWLALTVLCAVFFLGEHDDMRKARAALAPADLFSTLTAYVVTTRDALANPPACRVGDEPSDSIDAISEAIQLSLKNALVFDIGRTDSARRIFGCLYGLVQDRERVPSRVSTASTLQALASGLLIFLFVLAVRNLLRLQ